MLLLGAGVAAFLSLWAFWWEPSRLTDRETTLALPGWPSVCSGLSVAVLADLHVGSPYHGLGMLQRVVEKTLRADPDLILLAGDYVIHGVVGGDFVEPEPAAAVLERLAAPAGVVAVLGNHDLWLDGPRVAAALEARSIPVLENEAIETAVGKCRFWVAGVGDYWERAHDVEAALSAVPEGEPVLVLTHNPDLFPTVPGRVALTVAGHTHGGQVYLPGIGRPIVPSQFGERFAIGHVEEEGRHLFVSSGTGTSILPVRFLVPPEISLLVLESATPYRSPAD